MGEETVVWLVRSFFGFLSQRVDQAGVYGYWCHFYGEFLAYIPSIVSICHVVPCVESYRGGSAGTPRST